MASRSNTYNDDIRHLGVLVETVIDQNKAVMEAVGDMQHQVVKIPQILDNIAGLQQDVRIIKLAVTDSSREQRDHARRIANLEVAHPLLPAHQ